MSESRFTAPYEALLIQWHDSWIAAGLLWRMDVGASAMNPIQQDAITAQLAAALAGQTIRTADDLPLDLRRQLGV